ncbi:hypothetical protein EVAR_92855_1 [Eumeta japonica]|uniref:Uncharacterized protein n=1 Tax=Eumeta variegata TaxID=151549 RepID=A0A4C1TB06_EUMVA|nr:hypothetical protein EVAR_92855_1 [Eumeta japonica]
MIYIESEHNRINVTKRPAPQAKPDTLAKTYVPSGRRDPSALQSDVASLWMLYRIYCEEFSEQVFHHRSARYDTTIKAFDGWRRTPTTETVHAQFSVTFSEPAERSPSSVFATDCGKSSFLHKRPVSHQ